jgi:GT2 family glycosyltransferase
MKYRPRVSIIIPLYDIKERFFKDFLKYDLLSYSDYEIIVVCDKEVQLPKLNKCNVKLLLTHKNKTGPAEKRDLAIKKATGSICVFIDDDAYPDKDWIRNAVRWFVASDVIAVGGPGITPPEDNFWQKVGGGIVESYFCSGGVQYRYFPTKRSFVEDYPAYNLFVRKNTLEKVGGYGCNFYGGEDTFLCLKLIKYGGIIYEPESRVYHHRRSFPFKHLKQIGNVAVHRGYFFKKYPETSRMLFYLLPTFLTVGFIGNSILCILYPSLFLPLGLLLILFFWLLGSYSVLRHKCSFTLSVIAGFGIIITHVVYGVLFVKGLIINRLAV